MKRIAIALALALFPSAAWAQCTGIFPPNTLCGNLSGVPAPPAAFSASANLIGPGSSTVNNLALWANTGGTQLKDGGGQTVNGVYTWSGGQTYSNNAVNTYTGNSTLYVNVADPLGGQNSPNQREAFNINVNYDNNITSNPGFVFNNTMEVDNTSLFGDYNYGSGLTNSKSTFLNVNYIATHYGAGQHDIFGMNMTCYGKGDCSFGQGFLIFANYPSAGDEGTGYSLVSHLNQLNPTQLAAVVSTSKNTCNTTLTQSVTGAVGQQTVTVASGTGCTANTWIIVNREQATGTSNHEAVKIVSSTAGSITGIFRGNYNNGMTITPGLDMVTNGGAPPGQGRMLINISATPYTTGTIASITGGALTGAATGWSNAMIGGDAINPGCLSMTADNYSSSPFGAGNQTLHDYYQIYNLTSATSLSVWSYSAAGSTAYKGKGPGVGAYQILPCSEVVRVVSFSEVILADTTFTWANGNNIEYAIPPYPDFTGFQYQPAIYSSGGTYRSFFDIDNVGARKFLVGLLIRSDTGPIVNNLPGADNNAWGIGAEIDAADVGLCISCSSIINGHAPTTAAIALTSFSSVAGRIQWGPGGSSGFIQPAGPSQGIVINFGSDTLSVIPSGTIGSGQYDALSYSGQLILPVVSPSNGNLPTCAAGIEGALLNIPDGNSNTWGATVATFGTNHVLIRCNGTNWTVVGK